MGLKMKMGCRLYSKAQLNRRLQAVRPPNTSIFLSSRKPVRPASKSINKLESSCSHICLRLATLRFKIQNLQASTLLVMLDWYNLLDYFNWRNPLMTCILKVFKCVFILLKCISTVTNKDQCWVKCLMINFEKYFNVSLRYIDKI